MNKLLLAILLCYCVPTFAIDGAEMTYRCLGNNDYEITLKVYHDCAGAGMQGTPPLQVGDWVNGAITNIMATVPIVLDTTYEQNQIFNSPTPSICQGGNLPGMTVSVYKQTINFPSQKPNWGIQWTSDPTDLRSTTNLTSTNDLRIQALINNQLGCHDSPQDFKPMNLRYSAMFPGIHKYNIGGVPTDEYRMRYTLQALKSTNTVTYAPSLSTAIPLDLDSTQLSNAIFELHPDVGALDFSGEVGKAQDIATAVRIYMIDHSDTLGFVERDMLISMDTNQNLGIIRSGEPALITGGTWPSYSSNTFPVCTGDTLQFSIDLTSPTGDTIQLLPFATNFDQVLGPSNWSLFRVPLAGREDSVRFFVQAFVLNNAKGNIPLTIGVTGFNSQYPLTPLHIISFQIRAGVTAIASESVVCPNVNQIIQLDIDSSSVFGTITGGFSWQQISYGPSVVFSSSNIPNPTVIIPQTNYYGASVRLEVSYLLTDTISGQTCFSRNVLVIDYDTSQQCLPNNSLLGSVLIDSTVNCINDSLDYPFNTNLLVEFIGDNDTLYLSTDNVGKYVAILDTGHYIVSARPPSLFWTVCPDTQHVHIDTTNNWAVADFTLQRLVTCPLLNVNITSPILRRCFDNRIYIHYSNWGSSLAANGLVEIELDTSLYYVGSSIPLTNQIGNKYQFNIGNIGIGTSGWFYIDVNVSCFSSLGQIHCIDAHIYPDSICYPAIPNLLITDTCLLDTVHFTVTNLSQPYDTMVTYWALENDTIVLIDSVQLAIGNSITISYPTNGSGANYQLVFAVNFTGLTTQSRPINCTGTLNNINNFRSYNRIPYRDNWCISNIGSYDPNDKQGFPVGIDSAHYIPSNTTLDYLIRFQNTGTDTAIFINIFDTLSAKLDISTLQMGASSHPYIWDLRTDSVLNQSILRITFDPIYLPDSNVNLSASNGFVWYQISPKAGLQNFETITNSASIYFDYNAPIKTNTTLHTICDHCLPTKIQVITNNSTLDDNQKKAYAVYPNPTQGELLIEQEENRLTTMMLYSLEGRLLQTKKINNKTSRLNLGAYPAGIYFLALKNIHGTEQYKVILSQ